MDSWSIILTILVGAAAVGSAIALQFLPLRAWLSMEGLFASLTLGTVWGGWIALVLAELNGFSPTVLAVLCLGLVVMLLAIAWLRRDQIAPTDAISKSVVINDEAEKGLTGQLSRLYPLLMAAWLLMSVWLYFRPHEVIQGGADAGVYVSIGAEIAQNGGFVIADQDLAILDPAAQEIFLRPLPLNPVADTYLFPGFYVTDGSAGTVVPQFYPLHPVFQAVAFSLGQTPTVGVRGELLVTGLWMLLGSLAIVLTARELAGAPAALLVMAALSVTALQVWFARYPTTEALTQFLLWAGFWAVMRWQGGKAPAALWALVSGSALGAVFLVRIDVLVLLPIIGLFVIGLWIRGMSKRDAWFLAPFTILLLHSFLHGAFLSAPYFQEHIGYGFLLLARNWWIPLAAVSGSLLFFWMLASYRHHTVDPFRHRSLIAGLAIGLFLCFAIYGWFLRPTLMEPLLRPDAYSETNLLITDHENWRRLGWYLSSLGIWIGVMGICLLIWRLERKIALLVISGILFSALYLWKIQANPHQIYVMRRYVPVVAPFFLLAGAYLISQLPSILDGMLQKRGNNQFLGPFVAGLIGLVWLGLLGWSARGFVSQIDNAGILNQLTRFEQTIPSNSVILFNDQSPVGLGDFWGTPLKYIFGHDAYTIRYWDVASGAILADTIEFWQNQERSIVWIGDTQWLTDQGIAHDDAHFSLASSVMESSYEHKPGKIIEVRWDLPTAILQKNTQHDG